MNSKFLTLFGVAAGLLLLALIIRSADLAWMALPFLAYLVVGILLAPTPETLRLEATRSVEATASTGEEGQRKIHMTITVRNQGLAIDQLYLDDPPQLGMGSIQGAPQQQVALRVGEETTLTYSFQASRGQFRWESLQAAASDPLGLIQTHLEVPTQAAIQVTPDVERFARLPVRPLRTLHLAGSIPARLGGSGTDFWGIREYQPGDPLRRLDWHHAARHPGSKFTREFEQEEIAEIGLILDARQSADIQAENDSLFEHSTRAAASLAEVFLRQGNRVSLLVYGSPLITVHPGYGKVQLNRILNKLAQVRTEEDASPGSRLQSLALIPTRMFSSRSIILVISPLQAGDWKLFPRLRAYGYQVVLVSPDPVDFARQFLPPDLPAQFSMRLSQVERQLEIKRITRLWVPVVDWQVSQPLLPLVRGALNYSHLQHKR